MWQEYKKALAPAALAVLAVIVQYVITGEWDRSETAIAFTAFVSAGTVALVPNIPNWGLWRYLKGVVPAFITFSATIALWIETGAFNREELSVFLTGMGTAIIAVVLGNGGNTNEVGSKVHLVQATGRGPSGTEPGPEGAARGKPGLR